MTGPKEKIRRCVICGSTQRVEANHVGGRNLIAWFTGPFDRHADWVAAGRMLGRSWLLLTKHSVVLHPFGSIITNRRANAALQARIGADEPGSTTWLIARLGYSAEPPRSYRLEPRELIVG